MATANTWDPALRALRAGLDSRTAPRQWRLQGLKGGARAYFLWRLLGAAPRPAVVVAPTGREAERLASDLRFCFAEADDAAPFARRIHYLPSWEVTPFEDLSPTADLVAARIEGLYHLRQSRHPLVVTTPEALAQRVPPREPFAGQYLYVVEGEEVDRDAIAARLIGWGYRRVPLVEDRGDFSVRGGIIDVFPPAHPQPLRLQLEGDVIEAMHAFDPVSQRLAGRQPELLILPMREFDPTAAQRGDIFKAIEARALDLELARDERALILDGLASGLLFPGVEFCLPYFHPQLDTLWDYLPEDTVVFVDQAGEVDAALERADVLVQRRAAEREAEHRFFPPPERLYLAPSAWRAGLARFRVVELEPLDMLVKDDSETHLSVHSFSTADLRAARTHQRHEVSFAPVADQVRAWREEDHRIVFVAGTDPQAQRLARLLEANNIQAAVATRDLAAVLADPAPASGRPAPVHVMLGHFSEGFRVPEEQLVIVTEADVFGEARRRRARKIGVAQLLESLSEIKPDDFVIHLDHGLGRYRGLRHLQVAGTEGDYLHLEYAGGDRLYLPVDRISLVQKYVGGEGAAPVLDKLGGNNWEKVKARTKESILAMAKELLAIHAAREIDARPPYPATDTYFREFEATFPFEETPDQQQAIDDVLGDMQRGKPMDRLICGDVGYGKTEVALRAAFLAVIDGRQVALLVPTTVLAQQHFVGFRKRCEGYPVRVEMLSRFQTAAQQREVLRGMKAGTVDIVVGTHRLLQADVEFKQLGLLIIDEEHRFGVKHKEKIKDLRNLVDVMAMTATPIPRTLQMSLTGLRDLSVIETPPVDRLAVRTYVTRYDDDIIRDAMQRELARGGQVFFVHNQVENIELMARHLRTLVPEATIAVGHGQMHERELEKVMLQFMQREVNVLVCSTIIESGIDIPNANTIIINRADHFGLAQLYQLRGRVGRSHERAYAYLMIPGEHIISKDAQKRLRVLQELDDLGGGFKLAAHDLEIRGAGNLLGKQQSGHITAVGFDLYTHMMEEAVMELRGQRRRVEVEPEIQLGFPAYIPDSYIPDENQRLVVYRRLAQMQSTAELEEIAVELRERYGRIPPLVDSFLRVMDLRRVLKACMIVRAILRQGSVTLTFHPEAPVEVDQLVALVQRSKGRFRLSADFQLSFNPRETDWDGLVQEIQAVLHEIQRPLPPAEASATAARS
ncbi:MAG: transcription-repair coupling factor [Deltaproteobacteria bacterium]|nr:transcription-repair coupling factor [Deltaproteobacteria bacterium]